MMNFRHQGNISKNHFLNPSLNRSQSDYIFETPKVTPISSRRKRKSEPTTPTNSPFNSNNNNLNNSNNNINNSILNTPTTPTTTPRINKKYSGIKFSIFNKIKFIKKLSIYLIFDQ